MRTLISILPRRWDTDRIDWFGLAIGLGIAAAATVFFVKMTQVLLLGGAA